MLLYYLELTARVRFTGCVRYLWVPRWQVIPGSATFDLLTCHPQCFGVRLLY